MAPRISGKGVRKKCYFCCCLMQITDAEQVEQGTEIYEDVCLGELIGEEV